MRLWWMDPEVTASVSRTLVRGTRSNPLYSGLVMRIERGTFAGLWRGGMKKHKTMAAAMAAEEKWAVKVLQEGKRGKSK